MINPIKISNKQRETYYIFLDHLKNLGVCNTFGVVPSLYLRNEFSELNEDLSNEILADWMDSYDERHPE